MRKADGTLAATPEENATVFATHFEGLYGRRATFDASTDGVWPWIFDECLEPSDPECAANQCTSQRISACDGNGSHGLNPYQGRGAPEIDAVERRTGDTDIHYDSHYACQHHSTAPATRRMANSRSPATTGA